MSIFVIMSNFCSGLKFIQLTEEKYHKAYSSSNLGKSASKKRGGREEGKKEKIE